MKGPRKAAVFLTLLGNEAAAEVIKQLWEEARDAVIYELARGAKNAPPEEKEEILEEFYGLMEQWSLYGDGLVDVQKLLEAAYGSYTGKRKTEQIRQLLSSAPFAFIRDADPNDIYTYIQNEHPQTIAVILSCLPPDKAAQVLSRISPPSRRNDIARRIAMLERVTPDALEQVEEALKEKLERVSSGVRGGLGDGTGKLAQILVRTDANLQKTILENIDPLLAQRVRDKMFTFDDIVNISDSDMRRTVIRRIDMSLLPRALRGAAPEVVDKFLNNMSSKMRQQIEMEIELLGGIPTSQVNEARRRILDAIRELEANGEITVSRSLVEEEII